MSLRFPRPKLGIAAGLLLAGLGIFFLANPVHAQTIQEVCRRAFLEVLELRGVRSAFNFPITTQVSVTAGPAALAVGFINLLFAAPFQNIVRFFQFVLSEPGLALLGRKRKTFGVVYDSLSKRPLDLALVRVIDDDTGRIVRTRVTDKEGRFTMFLPKGRYRMEANKPGFVFPSSFLAGETRDINFGPIVTGEAVKFKESGALDVNLPMDGPEDRIQLAEAFRRNRRQVFHAFFAYFGIFVAALVVVYAWNVISWVLFGAHVLLFLVFERMTVRDRGRPWGRVYDAKSQIGLSRAVVRILDSKFARVLETVVTDETGRYGFLVGRNEYQVETLRSGYERYRSKPFMPSSRPAIVIQDIPLKPAPVPALAPSELRAA